MMSLWNNVFLLTTFCYLSQVASAHQLESSCSSGHAVVAYDNTSGVVVSAKSWPSGEQQTTVFSGATFPEEECGDTFVRCNLTTVFDYNSEKVAITVPLVQGVGLVLYDFVNATIRYLDHFLLSLLDSCHITQFFNSSGSIIGHCVNVTSDESLKHIELNINFTDLTQSTLSQINQPSVLAFPHDISQSVHFSKRANCFEDDDTFVFIIDGNYLDEFDLTDGTLEFFNMFDVSSSSQPLEDVDCVEPRRVKRVDDSILAIYCRNLTIELDVCDRRTNEVFVRTYNLSEGILYNCTTDPWMFVLEKNGSLIVPLNENMQENFATIPLPEDLQEIYTADCFIANEELFLVSTSFDGRTVSFSSQQQLFTTLGISDDLIPHAMYSGPSALFNSNGTSLLYNFSCPLNPAVITINHPFKLSMVIEGVDSYSCSCFEPGATTENSTFVTSTEKPVNLIAAIVSPIAGVFIIGIVIVIIVVIICVKRRNVEHSPVQATDDSGTLQANNLNQVANEGHHGDINLQEPTEETNGSKNALRSITVSENQRPVPTELVEDQRKILNSTEPSNDCQNIIPQETENMSLCS